jgi:hypothetical protein
MTAMTSILIVLQQVLIKEGTCISIQSPGLVASGIVHRHFNLILRERFTKSPKQCTRMSWKSKDFLKLHNHANLRIF